MLSAKFVKIHGMRDEKWTIKDKLQQYRGVLRLHARDKKLQTTNLIKLKKKVSRDLKTLSNDVREYRTIINDIRTGDKRRISSLFLEHKNLLLALINLSSNEIFESVYQDGSLKRKQLDKLFFQKKQTMKKFFDLKLEYTILSNTIEQEDGDSSSRVQQSLVTRYQRSMARFNAAQSIQTTYELMLNILKKDAVYFDAVLEALKKDQFEQCKVIIKTTVMGQLAAENLDDNREKYKNMAHEIWINMKERERTLKIAREQVDDIWAYAQSLVRVQSDTDIAEKIKEAPSIVGELESQIRTLEEVFDKIKESLRVRSFEELHSRLEEQTAQKEKLSKQFELALKKRDSFFKKSQHAELILATLEHTMVSTTGQYKKEKLEMLEAIKAQEKRRKDCRKMRKVRGKLLMNIRAALQNMADMLIMIEDKSVKETAVVKEATEENKSVKEEKPVLELKAAETDALILLVQVTQKATSLFAMSNFPLDSEKEERARDLYQSYVSDYKSNLMFGQDEPEPSGIFVDHEIIDPNIMSRKDIKKKSKEIVDAYSKED